MKDTFFVGTSIDTLMETDDGSNIRVYVHELAPFVTGVDKATNLPITIENIADNGDTKESGAVMSVATVLCTYLGSMFNTKPPNVHKDETVGVIGLGGSTDFYWFPLGKKQHRRMTEQLKIFVNNKDNQVDEIRDETAYIVDIDTRASTKKVHIATNKNMGEAFEYDILVDVEASTVHIKDDTGNMVHLDSNSQTWIMQNANGDKFTISPNLIQCDTQEFIVNAPGGTTINSPMTTMTGAADIAASATIGGSCSAGGSISAGGSMSAGGAVSSAGYSAPGGVWHKH